MMDGSFEEVDCEKYIGNYVMEDGTFNTEDSPLLSHNIVTSDSDDDENFTAPAFNLMLFLEHREGKNGIVVGNEMPADAETPKDEGYREKNLERVLATNLLEGSFHAPSSLCFLDPDSPVINLKETHTQDQSPSAISTDINKSCEEVNIEENQAGIGIQDSQTDDDNDDENGSFHAPSSLCFLDPDSPVINLKETHTQNQSPSAISTDIDMSYEEVNIEGDQAGIGIQDSQTDDDNDDENGSFHAPSSLCFLDPNSPVINLKETHTQDQSPSAISTDINKSCEEVNIEENQAGIGIQDSQTDDDNDDENDVEAVEFLRTQDSHRFSNLSPFRSIKNIKLRTLKEKKSYTENDDNDESCDESDYVPEDSSSASEHINSDEEEEILKPSLSSVRDLCIDSPIYETQLNEVNEIKIDFPMPKVDNNHNNSNLQKFEKESFKKLYPEGAKDPRSMNIDQNVEPSSVGGRYYYKDNFCIYCLTLQNRIDRHLISKHLDKPDVFAASLMKPRSKERRHALGVIRMKGNDYFNNNETVNPHKRIICARRERVSKSNKENISIDTNSEISLIDKSFESIKNSQDLDTNEVNTNGPNNYSNISKEKKLSKQNIPSRMYCEYCHGYFTGRNLHNHVRKEHNNGDSTTSRIILQNSKRNMGLCHKVASNQLRVEILGHLRLDIIGLTVRYDEMIILYGNKYVKKYNGQDQRNYVKSHMRLLAKLKIAITNKHPYITQLLSIFQAMNWPILKEGIDNVSELDEENNKFIIIYNAETLPLLLRKCIKILKSELTIRGEEKAMKLLTDFEYVFENNVEFDISYRAIMSRKMANRHAPEKEVPDREEIYNFDNYVKLKLEVSMEYLRTRIEKINESNINQQDKEHFLNIVQCVPVNILLKNRRRNTEIGRTLILDYVHAVRANPTSEFFKMLSEEEQKCRLKFKKINIQGKRYDGQGSLFITEENEEALDIMVNYRNLFGIRVTNPFLFAIPSKDMQEDKHVNVYHLMQILSKECSENYKKIDDKKMRCVALRSQLATFNGTIKQGQNTSIITKHLGHSEKVHYKHYKKAIDADDLTVLNVLEAAKKPAQLTNLISQNKSSVNIDANSCNTNEEVPSASSIDNVMSHNKLNVNQV